MENVKGDSDWENCKEHAPTHFRPISVINAIAKVIEKIVLKQLEDHFENTIISKQSGFCNGDWTTLQLYRLVQEWSETVEAVGIAFLDLQKAFDKIWHNGLLAKLKAYGLSGNSYTWIKNYIKAESKELNRRVAHLIGDPLQPVCLKVHALAHFCFPST